MKIVTVLGARPQFIKASAISRLISNMSDVTEIIAHTGQHYDRNMSQIFFDELDLPPPTYNLEVGSGLHGHQTGLILKKTEEILLNEKPDLVLVYGDTNSTLAGALAAAKLHIPVAHVEAGLRSFNRQMPEEINRIVTDHVSEILFAPSTTAMRNLSNEGLAEKSCFVGDVMYDVVLHHLEKVKCSSILKDYGIRPNKYLLCTLHRAENTDNPERLKEIVSALNELNQNMHVVFPLHPRTQKKIKELAIKPTFQICEPAGYLDMLALLSNSKLVLTDSGGLQKEAFFCRKFCVTLRNETEWVELVNLGVNRLAGADKRKIVYEVENIIDTKVIFEIGLYGDGQASQKILAKLCGAR